MTYEELIAILGERGLALDDKQIESFRVYATLLREWNQKMNLTSIVEESEVIEKHFLDSLLIGKGYNLHNRDILDVGSGAGFPGMALAIAYPDSRITLLDATKKKFVFLEEAKNRLGLNNVRFLVGRVEEQREKREKFDVVVSRGFSNIRVYVEVGAPLLRISGTLIAMKGPNGEAELKEAADIIKKVSLRLRNKTEDTLPNGDKRINYFFAKDAPTPKRYPRRWDEIIKSR